MQIAPTESGTGYAALTLDDHSGLAQTIPIVFVAMGDPVPSGVVPSLARPGANVTGTTRMISEMSAKHVELLNEAVPSLRKLTVLWNPTNSSRLCRPWTPYCK
jgi:ABC-type uncharacterized transport system substrate-binding protein